MKKQKYLYQAMAAVLAAVFAIPAQSAVNPDEELEGVEIGTPVKRIAKDGKVVWDICIGPGPCLPGQIKVAKSAEEEACMAKPELCDLTRFLRDNKWVALDPKGFGAYPRPSVSGGERPGPVELGCDSSVHENCSSGQQMGGNDEKKKKGQQMGPRFKKFMKGLEKVVDQGLSW